MTDLTVAKTILEQLGGGRFKVMTGAKDFVGSDNSLSFRLPGTSGFVKDRINGVLVRLDRESDTYVVEFCRIRSAGTKKGYERKVVEKEVGVYAEDLQRCFARVTGLQTRF